MKKKFLGRLLTMLLVAAMVFTLLPASAIAAAEWWGGDEYADDAATQATDDYKYNIFFLDCGRKYYSVDSIKQFIDNASAAGFNYIQLAVGNDGLRFLLDDMSLTVNGTTYDSDAVKSAIHTGNEAYYNFDVDELTQSEMDTIIAYASSKGMGVIPCVNTPGHMDAILSAATSLTGTTCSYNGSARTIDVTNATAVAFTQALLQKYMTYFAGKGCKLFNMGADEYANDKYKSGGMGFEQLIRNNQYAAYGTYINAVAKMIKSSGMKPMAFNDGIYFWDNTSCGDIDTDILVCYWSCGWGQKNSGYAPMSASDLAGKGFKLINTHGDYYWIVGGTQCSADKAAKFSVNTFMGSNVSNPVGSMFCIWSDEPGADTDVNVVANSKAALTAFGGALPKLSTAPVEPGTDIVITPDGGTSGTTGAPKLDAAQPEQLKLTASEKVLWRWNSEVVNLTSADPAEETGTIALYTMDTLEAQSVFVTPVAAGDPMVEVTTLGENPTTTKYPIEVVNSAAPTDGPIIELKVGDDETVPVEGHNYANDVNKAELKENIATVTVTGKDAVKTDPKYNSEGDQTLSTIVGNLSGREWQKTKYWYHPADADSGVYYPVYATRYLLTYYVGYSTTDNANDVKQEKTQSVLGI